MSLRPVFNPFAEYVHETPGPLVTPHGPKLFASGVQHVSGMIVIKGFDTFHCPEAMDFCPPQTLVGLAAPHRSRAL